MVIRENLCIRSAKNGGISLGFQYFQAQDHREGLVFISDSATVVAHMKNQRGRVSLSFCRLTHQVIKWPGLHGMSVSVRYILRRKDT